jgi:hypothetical protein
MIETIADEPLGTVIALSDSKCAVPIGSWGMAAAALPLRDPGLAAAGGGACTTLIPPA